MSEQSDTVLIKATHPYGFRYGSTHPWAVVRGLAWRKGRVCYRVWFPQGDVEDFWPVSDASDPYEFRAG